MTIIEMTLLLASSLGVSWILILAIATIVRPFFLRSAKHIGSRSLSTMLELGQRVLFTLIGTIVGSIVLASAMTVGAAAAQALA